MRGFLPPKGPTVLLAAWTGPPTNKNMPKRLSYGPKRLGLLVNEGIFCHLRNPRSSWPLGWAHQPPKICRNDCRIVRNALDTPLAVPYDVSKSGNIVRYDRRRFNEVSYLFRCFWYWYESHPAQRRCKVSCYLRYNPCTQFTSISSSSIILAQDLM
jgi:hypothetical protein